MKTLLVKDLPCVDGLDQQALRSVRGGMASLDNGNPTPVPVLIRGPWNPLPLPGLGGFGNLPVYYPKNPASGQDPDPGFSSQPAVHAN